MAISHQARLGVILAREIGIVSLTADKYGHLLPLIEDYVSKTRLKRDKVHR